MTHIVRDLIKNSTCDSQIYFVNWNSKIKKINILSENFFIYFILLQSDLIWLWAMKAKRTWSDFFFSEVIINVAVPMRCVRGQDINIKEKSMKMCTKKSIKIGLKVNEESSKILTKLDSSGEERERSITLMLTLICCWGGLILLSYLCTQN